MRCTNCAAENPEDGNYCQMCGTRLPALFPPAAMLPIDSVPAPAPERTPAPASIKRTPHPARQPPPTPTEFGTVESLGVWADGWADLIENASQQAASLRDLLQERLAERQLPRMRPKDRLVTSGSVNRESRYVLLLSHTVGATIVIGTEAYGKDLLVSWHLFLRINWKTDLLFGVLGVTMVVAFILGAVTDAGFVMFVMYFLFFGLLIFSLLGAVSRIVKGNAWTIFQQEYNHFRTEDITAMTLAVHKTILAALDEIGVETSLLRRKENFHAGSRERII